jgi:hypothetical protein
MNLQQPIEEIVIFPGAGPIGGWYWYFKTTGSRTRRGPFKIEALAKKDYAQLKYEQHL